MTKTEQDKETAAAKAQENNPQERNSEERTRMLLADYEARLDDAAELIVGLRKKTIIHLQQCWVRRSCCCVKN